MIPFKSRLQTVDEKIFPERGSIDLFQLGYVAPFETELPTASEAEQPPDVPEDASDLPPVVAAPPKDMHEESRKLLSPVWKHLTDLEIAEDDEELKQRRSELLQQLNSFTESLGTFLSNHRRKRVDTLTAEHERVAAECRKQRQHVEEAQQRVNDYQGEIRKVNAMLSQTRAQLKAVLEREPHPDNWPTTTEMHHWKTQHAATLAAADAADKARSDAFESDRDARRRLVEEQQKLAKLAQQESILRWRLSGRPWINSYGLTESSEL